MENLWQSHAKYAKLKNEQKLCTNSFMRTNLCLSRTRNHLHLILNRILHHHLTLHQIQIWNKGMAGFHHNRSRQPRLRMISGNTVTR